MSGLTTSLCGSLSKSIMNKIPLSFLCFVWYWFCQQKGMTKTVTWFVMLSCLSGSSHFTDVHTGVHMGTQEIQRRGKTIIFKTSFPLVTLKKLTRTPNCLCHTVIDPAPPQVHDSLELMSQTTFQTRTIQTLQITSHPIPPPFFVTFQLGHQMPELLDGVSFVYSCESDCPICA